MLKIILFLALLQSSFSYSQNCSENYHLQTYSSIIDPVQGDYRDYIRNNYTNFLLLKKNLLYFSSHLLVSDLLIFQNHNLFSKKPIKLLRSNSEHHFTLKNDSVYFWFSEFGMTNRGITIKESDSTFILFPTMLNKNIKIIHQLKNGKFRYDIYKGKDDDTYNIESVIKRRNRFRHPLGIRNRRKLLVMLFS